MTADINKMGEVLEIKSKLDSKISKICNLKQGGKI